MIFILVSSFNWVSAAEPYGYRYIMSHKLQGSAGLSNRTYYIDQSIYDAGYSDEVKAAVNG